MESYNAQRYKNLGLNIDYKQDNFSKSKKNVLRGIHFQKKKPQAKLFYTSYGEVRDVVVDLRKSSKTYLKHEIFTLSDTNKLQVYIPPGFGHGFLTISEVALCHYKCTNYYNPSDDATIIWNDELIKINWGIKKPILSKKDANGLEYKLFT
jgi:dTDP-4-dehydrorhamnose 3,5-epimerase